MVHKLCDIKSHMACSSFLISPSVFASSGRRYLARIKCVFARKLMFLSKSSKEDFVNVPVCKTTVTSIQHVMMYFSVLKMFDSKITKINDRFILAATQRTCSHPPMAEATWCTPPSLCRRLTIAWMSVSLAGSPCRVHNITV